MSGASAEYRQKLLLMDRIKIKDVVVQDDIDIGALTGNLPYSMLPYSAGSADALCRYRRLGETILAG
jgi:hypothetical protein